MILPYLGLLVYPPEVVTLRGKLSISTFNAPSATPVVLLYEAIYEFTTTIYYVGPADSILSGGITPAVDKVAPVKLNPLDKKVIVFICCFTFPLTNRNGVP
jgi:hypothetical protein